MTRKTPSRIDPLERHIEMALAPEQFIPDRVCYSFVRGLQDVKVHLEDLIGAEPTRAVMLYEAFLAGCYQKIEELDDSSSSFGQFVSELFCGWIKARQAAGADPEDTAARLFKWMEEDTYGFCSRLENDVSDAFDKPGLAAFVKHIRARFDAAAMAFPPSDASSRVNPEYVRRRWGEVLRTLYLAQKDVAAYVALAEETGLKAKDCHALGALLLSRRKPTEALAWVERGLALTDKDSRESMIGYDLAKLQRALLTKLGRGDEALKAAWAEYQKAPSKYSYRELMQFVPKDERAAWHDMAMDAAKDAALQSQIDLFLETKEIERLVELLRHSQDKALEDLSHYVTEPAAQILEKTYADVASRLWRAQGMRIINAKESKYYDAALANFERAMLCFVRAGQHAEWEKTVSTVRAQHHRKSGFIGGFEELVAGQGPSDKPSYLARAKARFFSERSEEP
jgi:hypothetical protein